MKLPELLRNAATALGLGAPIETPAAPRKAEQAPAPRIPRGRPSDFKWVEMPEFGGKEAIIYRSPDGKRVAAAFQESGEATFTYPFDELLIVTSGTVRVCVHGGETFELSTGEVAYITEGTTVDLKFSDDFSDVTCLMSDREVRWR